MAGRICPPWIGYVLLNPLRRFLENPDKILGPFVREGMTVLEPGSGMGYFTLPLARMVGPSGRVVVLEIQPGMLSVLNRRAEKAGLSDRIETRLIRDHDLGIKDLYEKIDLAVALHVVHEVPDHSAFFREIQQALKPQGKLLVVEPRGHVSQDAFDQTVASAQRSGLSLDGTHPMTGRRTALFVKPLPHATVQPSEVIF